jgi:hypothetical protein
MSNLLKVLAAMADVGRSTSRRVFPASEARILRNVEEALPTLRGEEHGFTFNPRTGRLLQAGSDYGHMMAQVPELPDGANQAGIDKVLELIRNPCYMDQLRRGRHLGGWYDKSANQFTIDPSSRFVDRTRSITRGAEARQKAGFSLQNFDEYQLTPELVEEAQREMAVRRALALLSGSVGGGAGVGTALGMGD